MTDKAAQKVLLSIQVLRAVAVLLVVMHHAARSITVHWPAVLPQPYVWLSDNVIALGAAGVDIFFVISGFIMVHVSRPYRDGRRPAGDFLIRRFIRIYPMYAIVTLIFVLISVYQLYRHGVAFPYTVGRIGAAFGFVPTFSDRGYVEPILGQGWTLFYEMFFYFCFAAVLAFSRQHLFVPLLVLLCTCLGVANLYGSGGAVSAFFSQTIMLEFLLGCAIGLAAQRKMFRPGNAPYWLALSVVLFAAASPFTKQDQLRFLLWGLPSALLLFAFLKLEMASSKWPRLLLLLGDASYSIYLTHIIFIFGLRDYLVTHFPAILAGDLLVAAFFVISVGLGTAIYLILEKPLNSWLLNLYTQMRPRGAVAAE